MLTRDCTASYEEKTCSFRHQKDSFDLIKDLKVYGLFWEQGCGKTKPTIDKVCYLFEKGEIEALIVIAPNGVHRNWANDEIPAHMPDRVRNKMALHIYKSNKAKQKKSIAARKALLQHPDGLRVLCISFSGIRTAMGKAFARKFMLKYKCMAVVDESQRIKSPGAKVTETVVAAGRYADYKMILSGTPITNSAFDVYSQMLFLDEEFWKKRGLHPFSVFQNHFGVFLKAEDYNKQMREQGFEANRDFDQLVGFKHLDELKGYIQQMAHRLTKITAGLNLPPKLYTKRYFELTPQQYQVYNQLLEDCVAFLPASGDWLETPESIVKITRLQQILNGYVATEADEPIQRIDDKNPLLDLYLETIADCTGKAITWSKYTPDINFIMEGLIKIGRNPVRYDGLVSEDQREKNKNAFQHGDATDLVGKPQVGATGVTLHAAEQVHYYSNSYNAEHRWQSEDRAHRLGLRHSVLYFDYIAENTIANDIITNLRKKARLSAQLLGDKYVETI
jgi:SNF2 family DNA or RNA helicase